MLLKMRKVLSILKNEDFPKADLNGDGVVDAVDLDILRVAVGYAACDGCPEDPEGVLLGDAECGHFISDML